jgi:hypothetical protein
LRRITCQQSTAGQRLDVSHCKGILPAGLRHLLVRKVYSGTAPPACRRRRRTFSTSAEMLGASYRSRTWTCRPTRRTKAAGEPSDFFGDAAS